MLGIRSRDHVVVRNLLTAVRSLRSLKRELDPETMATLRKMVHYVQQTAIHDLGKANDHFQGMVTRDPARRGKPQGLRHEWVTWLVLQRYGFFEWLAPFLGTGPDAEIDWHLILWSVAGHHPAFGRPSPPRTAPSGDCAAMTLLLGHRDLCESLGRLAAAFKPDETRRPTLGNVTLSLSGATDSALIDIPRLPPPATCYGFLLSLVGEVRRERHIGCRVAPAMLNASCSGDPTARSRLKISAAPSSSCRFHCVTCVGCTSNFAANSLVVRSPFTAAKATRAFNSPLCCFRFRDIFSSPQKQTSEPPQT